MEFVSALQHGFDDHKPSLFELLSEQQLSALIPPSLRYLLVLATQRQPRYLLRILNSFDELYAMLALIVERHYLQQYGSSFTEKFYGLKRERVPQIKGGEAPRTQIGAPNLMRDTLRLRTKDVWLNLAVLVGLPYIKRKLDEGFEIHAPQGLILGPVYGQDTLPQQASRRQKIMWYYEWFLRHVYPSMTAAYQFSLLAFGLAYLFDDTKYSSPFLWLIGTRIRRMSDSDHRAIALAEQNVAPARSLGARPGQGNSVLNPAIMAHIVSSRLFSSLKLLLPTSIFALKFLEWWHASDFARQLSRKAVEGLDLPPPVVSGSLAKPTLGIAKQNSGPPSMIDDSTLRTPNTVSLSSIAPSPSPSLSPQLPSSSSSASAIRTPKSGPPISSITQLPILVVPPLTHPASPLCPICLSPIQTPTAAQTGFVFCYSCIFKWVDGSHERQQQFMEGKSGGIEGWGEDEEAESEKGNERGINQSREGRWESGKGRCAVTGRRVLGETEGLRRVMV